MIPKHRFQILVFGGCLLLMIVTFNSKERRKLSSDEDDCSLISRLQGPLLGDDPVLLSFLRTHILNPPSTMPYNLTKGTLTHQMNMNYLKYSIFYKFVKRVLSSQPPGFFVEAGAFDGQAASNSLWLEHQRKWKGLLIEASPTNCKILKMKRRKAWSACSCITPKPYAVSSIFETPVQHHSPSEFDNSLHRSNVRSLESRFHTFDDIILKSSSFTYQTIQCFPLIAYLNALNVTTVDLLSLDTQGGEKTTVLSLLFEKIKVRYMFIEYFKKGSLPRQPDQDFITKMNQRNYKLVEMSNTSGEYIFMLNE